MEHLVIVGSGASAVHFALSVLKKGHQVTMVDAGDEQNMEGDPGLSFIDLKTQLADPVRYFLGEEYEGVLYPETRREYYGFPPHRRYIFARPSTMDFDAHGFEPLFSFAQGGLAEAWTGGVYPLNDGDLQDFPIAYSDLEPYYDEVADRMGITGTKDDLARFFPLHKNLMTPLELDKQSKQLLEEYEKHKRYINNHLKTYVGQSRIATLSTDKLGRKACSYKGRCLWGCPSRSLYTPSVTLEQCHSYPHFTYVPQMFVTHLQYNSRGEITSVVAVSLRERRTHQISADRFILAAGTLSSSKIFMDSLVRGNAEIVKLSGLMDNRQILVPYINPRMIGQRYDPQSYQYHQIAMGIEAEALGEYIHCQITTLKTAMIHPIVQNIPLDLRAAINIFRNVRAGLGIVNINLPDMRRDDNYVTLEPNRDSSNSRLVIKYVSHPDGGRRVKKAIRTVKNVLWKLGCIVPPGMIHVRPMGSSVHYAGTIPMSRKKMPLTASSNCQSNDFENLYLIDGASFPFLPAKNITFTLMANAVRVANNVF